MTGTLTRLVRRLFGEPVASQPKRTRLGGYSGQWGGKFAEVVQVRHPEGGCTYEMDCAGCGKVRSFGAQDQAWLAARMHHCRGPETDGTQP